MSDQEINAQIGPDSISAQNTPYRSVTVMKMSVAYRYTVQPEEVGSG